MHLLHLTSIIALAVAQDLPPISNSPNFRITANFNSESPLSVAAQGWNLTTYHILPGNDYVVLTNNTGRIFYNNGTADDFSSHTSQIWSDGGTPPWPWGVNVAPTSAPDEEGRRNVYVTSGVATPGVEVAEWPGTVYYTTGTFYVCNSTLLYGPAIALYYKDKNQVTPKECANVELQAWCLNEGSGLEHPFARNSTCYETTA
ncbi:hypothetical protein CC80DRAFT_591400 [Byssothecium circinans]|uniref:DUF7907 domain-containing protein n=1 Tax=Byssothecium circinans TaxID=147558 RepID=A0A6A5U2L9_9PLEO|nr:hypothetical protein CC80DRAFT_591400 [Byssothecium circinans]